ncbi:MAG: NUDIX hydrolase [Cytophagaceae bacterium]|nr:NUDIX hydrolase [Cytophagaceae bacterium]MDW8456824.1 NUDIX hydrolase [Cytophagaceae bacterium]
MNEGEREVAHIFGHRIRVRVCGICVQDNHLLLVQHRFIGSKGLLWAPPGGGMNYGESAEECLMREFKEETGLEVKPEKFLFVNEFIEPPLHAVELFFKVVIIGGNLIVGKDPEMKKNMQMIEDVKYMNFDQIRLIDKMYFHALLRRVNSLEELLALRGYIICG